MSRMVEGIQNALKYIEENLTEDLQIEDIAAKAYISKFYFQRMFNALCGYTVAEYIRSRRLALAAQELAAGDIKVIDAAIKYGYDSPDSFAKAFTKFHGISPSAARKKGANLRSYAPIRIKIMLEGGTFMEYKIVEKAAFTVMGWAKKFNCDTSYDEIPKFWDEYMSLGENRAVKGMFGVCIDGDGKDFEYLIADCYLPWNDIPEGYVAKTIPAGTWAVFPCIGALPKSLQEVNTKVWSEWLPSSMEYELAGNYNIEVYMNPSSDYPNGSMDENYYCELWIPIKKK